MQQKIWLDCFYFGFYVTHDYLRRFELHGQRLGGRKKDRLTETAEVTHDTDTTLVNKQNQTCLTRKKTFRHNIEVETGHGSSSFVNIDVLE